ncbi:MAG: prolyl oligopeptidase family serine peptidase, partial [Bdellovibrionales bacterium]|nr:prolyl oligopeptidase family serine peptidase [Bdellovibrionales bacterium]
MIPEAKSSYSWIDKDTIYVATDSGEGSLTDSGYPRTVKLLKRGQSLKDAPVVFEVEKSHQSAHAYVDHRSKFNQHFFTDVISFYQSQVFYFSQNKKTLIPMPTDASFGGVFNGYLLYTLKSDLKTELKTFKSGSLVALPINQMTDSSYAELETIFEPTDKSFLENSSMTKDHLLLEITENIQGKIVNVTFVRPNVWKLEHLSLGDKGLAAVSSTEDDTNDFIATYSDFTTPQSAYFGNASDTNKKLEKIKTSPHRFDNKDFITEQKFAKSKDGTMVPYFIIRNKNIEYNGKNPTLLYGYGGFEVSLLPGYLSSLGKIWLEKGGVYIMSNIRGGGEFGPAWHKAAQKEKHQVVFDDFIAIAEDLITSKITSPQHLGIQGGSNGGLLVAGTFIQRPDLFNAVLCEVPLLDMFRYHTLLAGASWMDEYGNPDDPKIREVISSYSPYQNVKAGFQYPEVFFFSSTKDDRVHPGHARKMVAKMREQGHPLFYYENIEGGHAGVVNIEQGILRSSLEYTFLWRKLK